MAYKVIDLEKDNNRRILIHGAVGTGKTRWAATWPKPLFVSASVEHGWVTAQKLPADKLYDPEVKPIVWAVESYMDFASAIKDGIKLASKGEVKTIVVDSLTYYAESYLSYLKQTRDVKDQRQNYGTLQDYIKEIIHECHKAPCNFIWICTSTDEDLGRAEIQSRGAINLPGRQLHRFVPGLIDWIFYFRNYREKKNGPLIREIRVTDFETYPARLRGVSDNFPEAFPNTTYRDFEKLLEEDEKSL